MTTLPTIILIIGSIIFFMFGVFVGVIIMALLQIGRESEKTLTTCREHGSGL